MLCSSFSSTTLPDTTGISTSGISISYSTPDLLSYPTGLMSIPPETPALGPSSSISVCIPVESMPVDGVFISIL